LESGKNDLDDEL